MLHLLVTSLCGINSEYFECQFIVLLSQTHVLDRCCNCFFNRFHLSGKRYSVALPSHYPLTPREPFGQRKRASFIRKWEKWLFLLGKVCHVAIPHYLCRRKQERFPPVFTECLHYASTLAPLPGRNQGGRRQEGATGQSPTTTTPTKDRDGRGEKPFKLNLPDFLFHSVRL